MNKGFGLRLTSHISSPSAYLFLVAAFNASKLESRYLLNEETTEPSQAILVYSWEIAVVTVPNFDGGNLIKIFYQQYILYLVLTFIQQKSVLFRRNISTMVKCCFVDLHLFSKSLSARAYFFSLIVLWLFPACFSWSGSFILSQSSLGSDDNLLVFEENLFSRDPGYQQVIEVI